MAISASLRTTLLLFAFAAACAAFAYIMLIPHWHKSRKAAETERYLLFAARHMMIQISSGVPLFDSMVSISENYGDSNLDYGEIGREFRKIVKEVRGGKDLPRALEESAARNPSSYYRRMMWQLSNSSKAGANLGMTLRDMTEYLSNEQRIMIRNYGSQLNPLAMFYMLSCIILPTMGLIFLTIFSSIAAIPIEEPLYLLLLGALVVAQIMFIGLIKSRRPSVAF